MRRVNRWLGMAVLALGLLPLGVGRAQEPTALTVTRVDTRSYPEVRLQIAATRGALPDPASLQVREDGRDIPADGVRAEQRRAGVAVSILIDASRSMRGRGMPESADRMQDAREQAIAIGRALDFDTDLISIYAFHREVVPVVPLSRVDGGAVQNTVSTAEVLGPIPDKPGGPTRRPTAEDLQNDPRAYSALSQAVGRAIDELYNPQTSDAYIVESLPAMQKVIIILADSCDDTLDARDSKTCSIPVDVQTRLQDAIRRGDLTIFSVGLGSTVEAEGTPRAPQRPDAGFRYAARAELLQLYAQQVPGSSFFRLWTGDAAQAAGLREEFEARVIEPILARGEQIELTYPSQVATAGKQREVIVSGASLRVSATFQEPPIPPSVNIVSQGSGQELVVRPEVIYAQSPLARVEYFVEGVEQPVLGVGDAFALNLGSLEPGERVISLEAIDQVGQRSPRSGTITIIVPDNPPPPPSIPGSVVVVPEVPLTPAQQFSKFILENIISLITLLMVIVLGIFMLVSPRGRAGAADATRRVTQAIRRVTQPLSSVPGLGGAVSSDYVLAVRAGGPVGQEYPLQDLNTFVGADPSLVDMVLNNPQVSGRHCSINREGNDLFVTDIGSTNGTYINGVRLAPQARTPLRPGDQLGLGSMLLECIYRGGQAPGAGPGIQPAAAQQPTMVHNPGQNGKN